MRPRGLSRRGFNDREALQRGKAAEGAPKEGQRPSTGRRAYIVRFRPNVTADNFQRITGLVEAVGTHIPVVQESGHIQVFFSVPEPFFSLSVAGRN